MISYIAVSRHNRSQGYLVVTGKVFVARSGGLADSRGDIPAGTFKLGPPEGLSKTNAKTMSDGSPDYSRFRKFEISAVGGSRQGSGIRDARHPTDPRTVIKFHFDGDALGSMGCIVYDDEGAQKALQAAFKAGDTDVRVVYVATDAEARTMAQQAAGVALPENQRPFPEVASGASR